MTIPKTPMPDTPIRMGFPGNRSIPIPNRMQSTPPAAGTAAKAIFPASSRTAPQ